MNTASIITIGDEILIGQIVDTNSSEITRALGSIGVRCCGMLSIADNREEIISKIDNELKHNDIVISTGGLGPTKDDITKDALRELFGARDYVRHEGQEAIVTNILHSRGLEVLDCNMRQAMVPRGCEVILNKRGTAPIMVFRFPESRYGHKAVLYALPGVPFEAVAAIPDILNDIKSNFSLEDITHRTIMTYGLAESALSNLIAPWEDALGANIHLAYLPNPLTGVRLRLSVYGGDKAESEAILDEKITALSKILGSHIYAFEDSNLETAIGKLLKERGATVSAAESCTGGEIAHLLTTVSGSSSYFLGSVTSYAISVKEKVLGVNSDDISRCGVVSAEVAIQMARGVREITGSTYSVSTTGLAEGCDEHNPEGTVWVGVAGPRGEKAVKFQYHNDRKRNIERFAASALDTLRNYIIKDINN